MSQANKGVNFSQIYGMKVEEFRANLSPEKLRQMNVQFITLFPKSVYIPGLRKIKARSMVEALANGTYENGNHKITYDRKEFEFDFYYRGTIIASWNAYIDRYFEVEAGIYEGTPSTINQRKEIEKSIQNFKEAVLKL